MEAGLPQAASSAGEELVREPLPVEALEEMEFERLRGTCCASERRSARTPLLLFGCANCACAAFIALVSAPV